MSVRAETGRPALPQRLWNRVKAMESKWRTFMKNIQYGLFVLKLHCQRVPGWFTATLFGVTIILVVTNLRLPPVVMKELFGGDVRQVFTTTVGATTGLYVLLVFAAHRIVSLQEIYAEAELENKVARFLGTPIKEISFMLSTNRLMISSWYRLSVAITLISIMPINFLRIKASDTKINYLSEFWFIFSANIWLLSYTLTSAVLLLNLVYTLRPIDMWLIQKRGAREFVRQAISEYVRDWKKTEATSSLEWRIQSKLKTIGEFSSHDEVLIGIYALGGDAPMEIEAYFKDTEDIDRYLRFKVRVVLKLLRISESLNVIECRHFLNMNKGKIIKNIYRKIQQVVKVKMVKEVCVLERFHRSAVKACVGMLAEEHLSEDMEYYDDILYLTAEHLKSLNKLYSNVLSYHSKVDDSAVFFFDVTQPYYYNTYQGEIELIDNLLNSWKHVYEFIDEERICKKAKLSLMYDRGIFNLYIAVESIPCSEAREIMFKLVTRLALSAISEESASIYQNYLLSNTISFLSVCYEGHSETNSIIYRCRAVLSSIIPNEAECFMLKNWSYLPSSKTSLFLGYMHKGHRLRFFLYLLSHLAHQEAKPSLELLNVLWYATHFSLSTINPFGDNYSTSTLLEITNNNSFPFGINISSPIAKFFYHFQEPPLSINRIIEFVKLDNECKSEHFSLLSLLIWDYFSIESPNRVQRLSSSNKIYYDNLTPLQLRYLLHNEFNRLVQEAAEINITVSSKLREAITQLFRLPLE